MKVAAFQAPLGVELLCCPEATLGGLADYVDRPERIAIDTGAVDLSQVFAPLASELVTIVIGFTERGPDRNLYNAAAVVTRGTISGIYRKQHPAINRSVYRSGADAPVFTVGGVTFGVLICRDSVFPEPAKLMVSRGAQLLLVPSNNGMPPSKGGPDIVAEARACDIARALESSVPVVRADVVGSYGALVSYGSSGIVDRDGRVLVVARASVPDLVVAEVHVGQPRNVSSATGARPEPAV